MRAFDRTDTSVLANWWWTVDRPLLMTLAGVAAIGVVFIFTASPPVAERVGLSSWHFALRQCLFLGLAALVLAGSASVLAGPGKGKGKGHGAPGRERPAAASHNSGGSDTAVEVDIRIGTDARIAIKDYYRRHPGCPPGLAKKRNGCLPPGQAKKRYRVGGVLPPDLRGWRLPGDLRGRLPAPPEGHVYAHVDGDVLLVAEATHRVIDAVVAIDAAVNALGD